MTTDTTLTLGEALQDVRRALALVQHQPPGLDSWRTAQDGLDALAVVELALQERPTLTAVAEAFILEVESAEAFREARGKGGQTVTPNLDGFDRVPTGAFLALKRYAEAFRDALATTVR